MAEIDLLRALPRTKRDIAKRLDAKNPDVVRAASEYGELYFDGPRAYGYGGYRYDGRWLPVARDIGFDLVQFGVFVTVAINLGLISPPVGLTVFVAAKVAQAPLLETFRMSLWWLPSFFILLLLVAFVPSLSLALL